MLSKEAAYKEIENLVSRFGEQIVSCKKTDYNETLTRKDFIHPLFKTLYWDNLEVRFLKNLSIDLPDKKNKILHNKFVILVDTMLQLQQQKQQTTLPRQLEQIEQRIQHTDNANNKKVYTLYGLTEEEIRMVEGSKELSRRHCGEEVRRRGNPPKTSTAAYYGTTVTTPNRLSRQATQGLQ